MRLRYCRQCGLRSASSRTRMPCSRALGRLEQRRDLDLVGDPVVPRQPEGGEQGVAGLGLGDEEADRVGAVDVLEDLGDRHHQPGGRGALGGQRTEIDVHRLHVVEERVDGGEVRAALGGVRGLALEVGDAAHRVVDLAGVQPEMRQGVREAVGGDAGAQERDAAPVRRRIRPPRRPPRARPGSRWNRSGPARAR